MPAVKEVVDVLRPFKFHGVSFDGVASGQALATCPFCFKEGGKFSVSEASGKWHCKSCELGGNPVQFLRRLWESSTKDAGPDALSELSADRKIGVDALAAWGVCRSNLSGEWLLPGFGTGGKLDQLYKYVDTRTKDGTYRKALNPTPGIHETGKAHALFGVNLFNKKLKTVYVCEAPWDGMALWEAMRGAADDGGKLTTTGSEGASLLAKANVIAVPSSTVFQQGWHFLLAGKDACFMYDNDHPKERPAGSGKMVAAGWDGMRSAVQVLTAASPPPSSIHVITWGEGGCDLTLKSGHDVRDHLTSTSSTKTPKGRCAALEDLLERLQPFPQEWLAGRSANAIAKGKVTLKPEECTSWKTLVSAMRKALNWTDNLHRTYALMLATDMSTMQLGSPVWIRVIGPPSSAKTTLAETLVVDEEHVFAVGPFTGLHSGWKTDDDGDKDHSLIPKINKKCFIIKDGDTLRTAVNREKILGELRDAYDCKTSVHYNNGVSRQYADLRFTSIVCATEAIRELDGTELGERYLDVVIMHLIDSDLEDSVNESVFFRTLRNVCLSADGTPESREDERMSDAKKLAGGYSRYLCENADRLLSAIRPPIELRRWISDLAMFVAHMRARPSKKQDEHAGREFSSRLVEQLSRLMMCVTAVVNKTEVDDEVKSWIRQTAVDTARGRTMEMARKLYRSGQTGMEVSSIAVMTGESEEKVKSMMTFLKSPGVGVAEVFISSVGNVKGRPRWRLTPTMSRLWESVVENKVTINEEG